MDGTRRVYYEIFHETSNGDFGIEVPDGPLLRCHTHILAKVPGFLGKIRQMGRPMARSVPDDGPGTSKDYFKQNGLTRMFEDSTFVQFSQPLMHSAANASSWGEQPADPLMPGYSTSTMISGDTGAVRRIDQFFLAERYEIDCDVERLCEMLRYIYQGYASYFDIKPRTDAERADLAHKMLELCKDSERFSVDALYEKLLSWFGREAYFVVGEKNFASSFYHMQHFEMQCTEEHSRQCLVSTVTGDMLSTRRQFRAVTMDPRWNFLPVDFVEGTLDYDFMPISSELEVLNLIERWNANADKPKEQIIRLLGCFRPDGETKQYLESWLLKTGWIDAEGNIADMPELLPLRRIMDPKKRNKKKPRKNLKGHGADHNAGEDADEKTEAQQKEEAEMSFMHYKGNNRIGKGSSFTLGANQRLVQADPIRHSGIQRMRVVLSNPRKLLWDPQHEVFVGLSYGKGRWFGYLCSATAFSGIFAVRAYASAAPVPNAPVHLTGSGNKVEFDIALEVQLQRVNLVVTCKLSIIFANETVTEELFQIASETLRDGPGLRYQVVAANLKDEEVDVSLACVSGGANDEAEAGPEME